MTEVLITFSTFFSKLGKGFAAKHGLLLHNKRHPNGGCTMRSHVCECGKAFFQKNHLMLHQRQHMEQKPNIQQVSVQKNILFGKFITLDFLSVTTSPAE